MLLTSDSIRHFDFTGTHFEIMIIDLTHIAFFLNNKIPSRMTRANSLRGSGERESGTKARQPASKARRPFN